VLELSSSPTTERVAELEWPQEVCDSLEVWSDSDQLVNDILDGDDAEFAKVCLDDGVVSERDSLTVDLAVTSLVDELTNGLEVWLSVGNVWLDEGQHLGCSLGELDKDTVVNLQETQQLHDLSWLWWDLVDTLDSDDEGDLWLSRDVEVTISLCDTLESDLFTLGLSVFLNVLLCPLENDFSLLLGCLLSLDKSSLSVSGSLVSSLPLLEDRLWNWHRV